MIKLQSFTAIVLEGSARLWRVWSLSSPEEPRLHKDNRYTSYRNAGVIVDETIHHI